MKNKKFTIDSLRDIIERYGYKLEVIENTTGECMISILDNEDEIPFHVRVNEGGKNNAMEYMLDMLIDIALRKIDVSDEE